MSVHGCVVGLGNVAQPHPFRSRPDELNHRTLRTKFSIRIILVEECTYSNLFWLVAGRLRLKAAALSPNFAPATAIELSDDLIPSVMFGDLQLNVAGNGLRRCRSSKRHPFPRSAHQTRFLTSRANIFGCDGVAITMALTLFPDLKGCRRRSLRRGARLPDEDCLDAEFRRDPHDCSLSSDRSQR